MRLYLVRHAHADPGEPDDLRPLSPSGHAQARRLAERLAAAEPPPATVVASPLLRARETAAAIAKAVGVELQVDERLAPGADAAAVAEALAGRAGPAVVVGHQPDCSEIAFALSGRSHDFAPAAVLELEL